MRREISLFMHYMETDGDLKICISNTTKIICRNFLKLKIYLEPKTCYIYGLET